MAELFIDPARESDLAELGALIRQSAQSLCTKYYEPEAVSVATGHYFDVDRQLVRDDTYFVARVHGRIVGCGGWSSFASSFGADYVDDRADRQLDPRHDSARICAFFVSPDWTRVGIATALLETCEAAASEFGFSSAELMATLSAVPFYTARGYAAEKEKVVRLGDTSIRFVSMRKSLRAAAYSRLQPGNQLQAAG